MANPKSLIISLTDVPAAIYNGFNISETEESSERTSFAQSSRHKNAFLLESKGGLTTEGAKEAERGKPCETTKEINSRY